MIAWAATEQAARDDILAPLPLAERNRIIEISDELFKVFQRRGTFQMGTMVASCLVTAFRIALSGGEDNAGMEIIKSLTGIIEDRGK